MNNLLVRSRPRQTLATVVLAMNTLDAAVRRGNLVRHRIGRPGLESGRESAGLGVCQARQRSRIVSLAFRTCLAACAVLTAVMLTATTLQAQSFNPYPGLDNVQQKPQSYSDFYRERLQTDYRPTANMYNYTYNRYFYHRPTLSPYLNLTRPTTSINLNNYYRWVRPEMERRQNLTPSPLQKAQVEPPVDLSTAPMLSTGHRPVQPLSNPYFNQYYNYGAPMTKLPPQPLPPQASPQPGLPKLPTVPKPFP